MTTLSQITNAASNRTADTDSTAAALQVVFVIAAFVTIALVSAIVQQLIPLVLT